MPYFFKLSELDNPDCIDKIGFAIADFIEGCSKIEEDTPHNNLVEQENNPFEFDEPEELDEEYVSVSILLFDCLNTKFESHELPWEYKYDGDLVQGKDVMVTDPEILFEEREVNINGYGIPNIREDSLERLVTLYEDSKEETNFDNLYLHITCSFFADSVLGGGLLQQPIHRIGERDREQNLNTMSLNNTNNST